MVVRHVIFNTLAQHKKKPSHDGPFSFLVDPPLLARYPAVAGHCSLEPTPLKPHDAHIIFPMTPYLLHAIFPDGPPRRSIPPTTTLSALNPPAPIRVDPPPPVRSICIHLLEMHVKRIFKCYK